MTHQSIAFSELGVTAELATFAPSGKVTEQHVILHVEPRGELFQGQFDRLCRAQQALLQLPQCAGAQPVFKRYFLSDATNQEPLVAGCNSQPSALNSQPSTLNSQPSTLNSQPSTLNSQPSTLNSQPSTVSCIQQSPLDGSKVAAWIYLVHDMKVEAEVQGSRFEVQGSRFEVQGSRFEGSRVQGSRVQGSRFEGSRVQEVEGSNLVVVSHNGYKHLWQMGMCAPEGDSAEQTERLLVAYEQQLQRFGATLADNCIRTWFYVRDVDIQYAGMVRARRENFERQGLTPQTHFIASTGIEGKPANPKAIIQLGTYALTGLQPEQQQYLYAKSHLNPTYEYGVTFERGTRVDYGDRRHVYISGTASINNRGEVMYVGDIVRQTLRMWANVEALLAEAETTFDDVAQIIVYLRDAGDYQTVRQLFCERFPNTPFVITLAPVCRPTWLIEMECVAIKHITDNRFRDF